MHLCHPVCSVILSFMQTYMCPYIHVWQRNTNNKQSGKYVATHCYTLQHTATHCNTLQRTATHCNTLFSQSTNTIQQAERKVWSSAAPFRPVDCCSVLQCVAVCCSVLQCVAVCCNTLNTTNREKCVLLSKAIPSC